MKKWIALVLSLMLLVAMPAMAEDLGVQVIGGDDAPAEPLSLDDMQLGQIYEIEGYAKVIPQSFNFYDSFAQYNEGAAGNNEMKGRWVSDARQNEILAGVDGNPGMYMQMAWNDSGTSADFAWLAMDVINAKKQDFNFLEEATVSVFFEDNGDEYEYAGWVRQMNFDFNQAVFRFGGYDQAYAPTAVVAPVDVSPVGMLYTGNYVFGCTLPNMVVESKAPLRMVIKLGENELTYNIRK